MPVALWYFLFSSGPLACASSPWLDPHRKSPASPQDEEEEEEGREEEGKGEEWRRENGGEGGKKEAAQD